MRAGLIRLCLMTAFLILLQTAALCGGTAASAEDSKAAGHTEKELAVDLTGTGDGYSAVLYDNSNGLPTSEANAIAETEEGFIWIGSYSGLIRYDGNTFERMDSTSGLASVLSLFVDSRNRLWVGTNDSGAAVMENGTFTMLRKADGLTSLSVRSITEDPAGTIYLGTTAGLALVDADMHLEMMQDPQIRDEYIRMLRICGDTVYGVTKNGAVFAVRDRELLWFYDSSKTRISDIHAILPDPENPDCAYVGSQGSDLYYVRFSGNVPMLKRIDISPCNYINDIALAGDLIWLCTDTGIGFLTDDNFVYIRNIPMNTAIEGMMSDYQRNLWFVSSQQGVMKIVPDQFTDVFDRCRLSPEVVYSTCMYGDKLLVGTKNTGLLVLEDGSTADCLPVTESRSASGKVFGDTNLVETLKDSKIRSIIRDSQNRLWFSTFGEEGLLRYDNGALLRFTEADGMPSERVRAVYECVDGRFLAACTGGVAVIEGDRVVAVHGESDKIANTEILTVTEGVDGAYILGTDGGGIYVINGRKVSHYGTDDGLLSDVVMRIKKDVKRDLYWIVTSNSPAYMTADYQITTVTNFPYSNNFDLYENSRNEMWVLSSNGIYVADTDQLLQNEEISYLFYNGDNGMPCISTSNSYSELTENGDLYIAGTTGIAKVNIEIPFENVNELKLAVPFLEADGKPLYPDTNGKFTVPASTKKVTIYSYVYNYSLINPQVTYRLIGFDTKPVTVLRSDLSAQDYTNLHGGTYRFYLEIQDPHGMSKKELTVTIEKQKHLYEMFWVRFLMILAGAAILAVLIRLYIRRRTEAAEKRNEQQKQLTREIVEAFSKVIDMKDRYTNGHSARVAEYTVMLSREMGLDEETIEQYYCIALLHDIGKIGVPAEVLNKNGKLTDDEFRVIKSHSELGSNALKDISIMPELSIGAGAHHERPDGKGYPNGLTEEEIPLVAKIIAVADTFDAMYSDRPYRKRMNFDKAVSIIKGSSGTQLSSEVVDAFLRLVEQGRMRAADDTGGGTTEDIDNIRKAGAEP
ncbi:MAG: HD domain-containing protein [Oscillospiraceae bacterium]|nr:HD domain-containing protein [Oscillospiraceae bacterium]